MPAVCVRHYLLPVSVSVSVSVPIVVHIIIEARRSQTVEFQRPFFISWCGAHIRSLLALKGDGDDDIFCLERSYYGYTYQLALDEPHMYPKIHLLLRVLLLLRCAVLRCII